MLLHYAGPNVQDIYFALSTENVTAATTVGSSSSTPGPNVEDEYVRTVRLLNCHFAAEQYTFVKCIKENPRQ
jgi:hypothetical protein